jgi:hypothetical protein
MNRTVHLFFQGFESGHNSSKKLGVSWEIDQIMSCVVFIFKCMQYGKDFTFQLIF